MLRYYDEIDLFKLSFKNLLIRMSDMSVKYPNAKPVSYIYQNNILTNIKNIYILIYESRSIYDEFNKKSSK